MANYKRFGKVLSTSDQDLLTCGAGVEQLVKSISLSNSSGSAVVATIKLVAYAEGATFVLGYVSVPANGNAAYTTPVNLNPGDKISAVAATGSVITATGSYLEKTGSTPIAQGFTPKGAYAGGTTYDVNDIVSSGGKAYLSQVASNVGNTPSSSPTQWLVLTDPAALSLVTSARTLTAAGLVATIGDLSADRTINVPAAAAADVRTGTDTAKAMTPGGTYAGLDFVTLTDAATIAVDMAAGTNFTVTLGGNRTLGAPTNAKPGQGGMIECIQDGTGSRTLAFASAWKRVGGAPTLSTAAGAKDYLHYKVRSSGLVIYSFGKAPS